MQIINYSEKAIALIGNTKPVKDQLVQMFGKYNPYLKHPETGEVFKGWIFSKKREDQIKQFVETACNAASQPANNEQNAVPKTTNPQPKLTNADLFFKTAQSLNNNAAMLYKRLSTKITNTPKRQREYASAKIEADQLSEKAKIYLAIGEALQNNTLPKDLQGFSPAQTKDHAYYFIRGAESTSYYEVTRSQKLNYQRHFCAIPELNIQTIADADRINQAINSLFTTPVIDTEQENKNQLTNLLFQVKRSEPEGFFPTPADVVNEMINIADIQPSDAVLEPSAGIGSIVEIIKDQYPSNTVHALETNHTLIEIMKLKGIDCFREDFLNSNTMYDKIIMNPPFENKQDIDHVLHAFSLLNPGGRVVAIMSAGSLNCSLKKAKEFQDFVNQNGYYYPMPENSFANAFIPTKVNTCMVVLDKE